MRTAAFIHLTGVTQPTSGTGGSRGRAYRDLVRASLRAVPGPSGPTHRRWTWGVRAGYLGGRPARRFMSVAIAAGMSTGRAW